MWPSDSNKIFNVALRRKSLPTPGLMLISFGINFTHVHHSAASASEVTTLWRYTNLFIINYYDYYKSILFVTYPYIIIHYPKLFVSIEFW